jgi:hypothetical protein
MTKLPDWMKISERYPVLFDALAWVHEIKHEGFRFVARRARDCTARPFGTMFSWPPKWRNDGGRAIRGLATLFMYALNAR